MDIPAVGSLAVVDIRLAGTMAVAAGSARRSSLVRAVGHWVGGMDRRLGGRAGDKRVVERSPEVCVIMAELFSCEGGDGGCTYVFV